MFNNDPYEEKRKDHIINIHMDLGSEIGVAGIQIATPFSAELDRGKDRHTGKQRDILFWRDTESRTKKILDIINSTLDRYDFLHVISLPEYSTPQDSWEALKTLSDNHNVIIIGGSDYDINTYRNICPIFIPSTKTLFLVKYTRSIFESGLFFGDIPDKMSGYITGTVYLRWEFETIPYEIQILICSDLLRFPYTVDPKITGLIVCPMCSPATRHFYGLSEYFISLSAPKYVLLNNCCQSSNIYSDISPSPSGLTGICCSLPTSISKYPQLRNNEGVLYAKLNMHSARVEKPTPLTSTDSITLVESTNIFKDNQKYTLCSACFPDSRERAAINPDLFRELGKKLRIYYLKCKSYSEATASLPKTQVYACGVLGNVDIIVRNINDESGKLKEYDFHDLAPYFTDEFWSYFSVDRFIKFDGHMVKSGSNAIAITPNDQDLEKIVKLAEGQLIDKSDYDRFLSNKWIVGSTLECEDLSKVKAIINISLPELLPTGDVLVRFDKNILSRFYTDKKISGIYEGVLKGGQANFVLEVCCNVNDLFHIVTELHDIATSNDIRINTGTYLLSNTYASNLYSSLLIPTVPYKVGNIISMHIYKDMGHEFCSRLRMLPLDQQEDIVTFYKIINNQHGRISDLKASAYQSNMNIKYTDIIEAVEQVRKDYTQIKVNGKSISKASQAFTGIFLLFDAYIQELLNILIDEYYEGSYEKLLFSIEGKYKPRSPKPDISRLTVSERSNLIKGIAMLYNDHKYRSLGSKFLNTKEFELMVQYRNAFSHNKHDEIAAISMESLKDLTITMIECIDSDFVTILKTPIK